MQTQERLQMSNKSKTLTLIRDVSRKMKANTREASLLLSLDYDECEAQEYRRACEREQTSDTMSDDSIAFHAQMIRYHRNRAKLVF
jgi:hypothetical protein